MRHFLPLILIIFSLPAWAGEQIRQISVTGVGHVSATPDLANVTLGVEATARTSREALATNSAAMTKLIAVLAEQNVEARDIQTTQLSLFPRFENRNSNSVPRVVGYQATNLVQVRIRNLEILGQILDAISEAGGNRIQSISFGLSNNEELLDIARQNAVKDGIRRAELYASAAGINLGQIISISDTAAQTPRPQHFDMARAETMSMDVPISEGVLNLSASIYMVFEIE